MIGRWLQILAILAFLVIAGIAAIQLSQTPEVLWFAVWGAVAAGVIAALALLLARQTRRVEAAAHAARVARAEAEAAHLELRAHLEERERAQAALRQVQRIEAVSQLTSGVAHDFNNLLTVILGSLVMLRRRTGLPPELVRRLDVIEAAAERGATLTNQLLAFSRKQPLDPSPVALNALIEGMAGLLRSTLGSTMEIETVLAPELWSAMVDPTQVELLILNLALNARDATPAGGRLVIETANAALGAPTRPEHPPPGDYVMVSATDTGAGMTEAVLARACEPFFTTKEPGKGSGLGLSQVFGVARELGGGLAIESAPGSGTAVKVYLPRATAGAAEADAAAPPSPGSAAQAGPRVVLLVDDDAAVRAVVTSVLEDLGYRVVEQPGGAAALDWLRQSHPVDVVLSDLAMPAMSGAEMARRVRALRPDLPIVFLTGYADAEALAGDLRPERLVRKPFRSSELADKLEAAIREQPGPATRGD